MIRLRAKYKDDFSRRIFNQLKVFVPIDFDTFNGILKERSSQIILSKPPGSEIFHRSPARQDQAPVTSAQIPQFEQRMFNLSHIKKKGFFEAYF